MAKATVYSSQQQLYRHAWRGTLGTLHIHPDKPLTWNTQFHFSSLESFNIQSQAVSSNKWDRLHPIRWFKQLAIGSGNKQETRGPQLPWGLTSPTAAPYAGAWRGGGGGWGVHVVACTSLLLGWLIIDCSFSTKMNECKPFPSNGLKRS